MSLALVHQSSLQRLAIIIPDEMQHAMRDEQANAETAAENMPPE